MAILLLGPLGQYMAAAFCDHALEAAGGQLWTIHRGKDRLISSPQDIPNESTYTGRGFSTCCFNLSQEIVPGKWDAEGNAICMHTRSS